MPALNFTLIVNVVHSLQ